MTFRELLRQALPPAPETDAMRRLRVMTSGLCVFAGIVLIASRALGNRLPGLTAFSMAVAVGAFVALAMLLRAKVRYDLQFWTPERIALHRELGRVEHPDRPTKAR